ncbi:Haloacid dehalogenase-like hydrolase domain-containing protein 3 [Phytophthora pseudosyringae]|uniref:Haloacid dehalogenase-like hydrolase domain-containing protein 3 n=1 Tax=Phytophthora pseudosyringae TaxID=221518 RepID=A0A8T1W2Y5_9STRA|nr:Haloacid dehalogenase-like hydrolase domain-containing protein 3 [Phytophthora pseudosyringae]
MTIVTTPTYFVLLAGMFRLVVGGRLVWEILKHQGQLFRFAVFLSAQTLMSIIYPAYQALFHAAAGTGNELLVVALLPVVKLFMKIVIALSFRRTHDMMPEAVIFSVDFFNAFYIVTSMQSASSTTTVDVIMATDVLNTFVALNSLQQATASITNQLRETICSDEPQLDLLGALCSLCRRPKEMEMQERTQIQLRSCIPYRLSTANADLVDRLSKVRGFRPHARSFSSNTSGSNVRKHST